MRSEKRPWKTYSAQRIIKNDGIHLPELPACLIFAHNLSEDRILHAHIHTPYIHGGHKLWTQFKITINHWSFSHTINWLNCIGDRRFWTRIMRSICYNMVLWTARKPYIGISSYQQARPNPIPEQFNEFLRCCFFFGISVHLVAFWSPYVYSHMRECYAETFSILLCVLLRKVPRHEDRYVYMYEDRCSGLWTSIYTDTTETIAIFLRHIKCGQVNFGVIFFLYSGYVFVSYLN